MKRSNVELAKRIFLDRLTTDAQPLLQPANIDAGPGDVYEYAGTLDPYNFGVGGDCSGVDGIVIGAALLGPQHMSWGRLFSTETFPGPFADRFRQVSKSELLSSPAPIKVMIEHGGGGPNSHMACVIDGWHMESNGSHGIVGGANLHAPGAYPLDSDLWNDWWICTEPIEEDTTWRQPMSYPKGVDYAGGRISAKDLKAAGISFVCRYLNDGRPQLPGKQLLPSEFADLTNNGVPVVFNYETTADFMLYGGFGAGAADAQDALDYILSLPGVPRDWKPVVYFSADFDEAPAQDAAIFDFCDGAAQVLGAEADGRRRVGLYGAYWITKRARDAGKVGYTWQTEAWSGGNIDSRVNIMQRNNLGYLHIGGVECDINEAHTDAYGQFVLGAPPAAPPPPPVEQDAFLAWMHSATDRQLLEYLTEQIGPGNPAWANKGMTLRDKVFSLATKAAARKASK
jgi:hypothetical protein